MDPRVSLLMQMWEDLEPLRQAVVAEYKKSQCGISAFRFRGYNPNSVNSPEEGGMTLWINCAVSRNGPLQNQKLLDRYEELLKKVWQQALEEISDHIDHIMVVPDGSVVFEPGIYPDHVDMNHHLPIYQPYQ